MGGIACGWATIFMVCEEVVDNARGRILVREEDDTTRAQRDAASTVVAAMSTAAVYSWKNGLDHYTAARLARTALKVGLTYGIMQDLLATLRGNKPAYITWVGSKMFGQPEQAPMSA